jgi:NADH-quinone oxidoreductase subunit N
MTAIDGALLHSFRLLTPEAILGFTACILFVGSAFQARRKEWAFVALFGLVAAAVAASALFNNLPSANATPAEIYAAPLYLDRLAIVVKWLAFLGGAVLIMASWEEVPDQQAGEYYGCLLLIVAGLSLTGSANELITLFLALELISIPTYVILYLPRSDKPAQEAATKYFLLSVFSSAFLLFGFSYLYGLSGTTNIPALLSALDQPHSVKPIVDTSAPGLALAALVMIMVGIGFRITAVPFHFYAPDVYQGTATVVAALLAFIPKVAGFAALVRILGFVLAGREGDIPTVFGTQMLILLWILSAATMTFGNIVALLQNNLKRLLAYSSIAHAGYMLIGVAAAYKLAWPPHQLRAVPPPQGTVLAAIPPGVQSVFFYLIAYGAMTIGAFVVISYLSTPERPIEAEDDLAGLGTSHPGIAFLMAVFLFSLIGMPLTGGFAGKFLLFSNALSVQGRLATQFYVLAAVGAINAAIGAWYYLRILSKMYLHGSIRPIQIRPSWPALVAILFCAGVTIFLGVYPNPVVELLGQP